MSAHNDTALQRLAHALALGDGFQFHILVCHSPLQVGQSLTTLAEAIPALRGGSLITRPLLPDTFSPDKPLDSALTAAVTEALSTLPPPTARILYCTILMNGSIRNSLAIRPRLAMTEA